jgi:hypothetical protein
MLHSRDSTSYRSAQEKPAFIEQIQEKEETTETE